MTKYYGWTNHETWTVNHWLDNDIFRCNYWHTVTKQYLEAAENCHRVMSGIWTKKQSASFRLADRIKHEVEGNDTLREVDVYSALLSAAFAEVNWLEIATVWVNDCDLTIDDSRGSAIKDGSLIDATTVAHTVGIAYPTAFTAAAWARYISVPYDESQHDTECLWDVLAALHQTTWKSTEETFFPAVIQFDGAEEPVSVTLKAVRCPGDDKQPVITIMLPDEL